MKVMVLVLGLTLSSWAAAGAQEPRPFTDQDKQQLITGAIIGLDMARAVQGLPDPMTIEQAQSIIRIFENITRGCTSLRCMIDRIVPMIEEVRRKHRPQA